jgi:hypothetical protein
MRPQRRNLLWSLTLGLYVRVLSMGFMGGELGGGRERKRTGQCHPCPMLPAAANVERTTNNQPRDSRRRKRSRSHTFVLSESLVLVDWWCIFSFGGHPACCVVWHVRSRLVDARAWVKLRHRNWHQLGPNFLTVTQLRAAKANSEYSTSSNPIVYL